MLYTRIRDEMEVNDMKNSIVVKGAKEHNLKDVSVSIPKNKFIVLTGPSGSGKSTLAMDTLYKECQRQYLESMGLQGIEKPKVRSEEHTSELQSRGHLVCRLLLEK